jgi:hypothetical protein
MRVVVVVVLLALAGCNGAVGPQPTETVTPVPELAPEPVSPPGVSEEGVTDPEQVASVHGDRLAETSYTLTSTRTVRAANRTVLSHFSVRVELDEDRTYHARARTDGPWAPEFLGRPPATAEFWSDGETYLRKLTRDGTTSYDELEPGPQRISTWRYWTRTAAFGDHGGSMFRTVRDVMASFSWEVRAETVDETTLYRLDSDEHTSTAFTPSEVTAVRNATATATMTESGVIRSIQLEYVGRVDGETVVVERTIRYDDLGNTAVDRPTWSDRLDETDYERRR